MGVDGRGFNADKLKSILPNFYQHVETTFTPHKETHTKLFLAIHLANVLLIPAYKQKLKQEVPVTRSIWKWSDDTDATLQDCFARADCNMFRDSSNGIEYTTVVTGIINKCIEEGRPGGAVPSETLGARPGSVVTGHDREVRGATHNLA